MVTRIEEEPDAHLERSSSGIFGAIQIHARDGPESSDLLEHEERTR